MFAIACGLLSIYWLARIFVGRPSSFSKGSYICFAILSLGLFLSLPKEFSWIPFLVITALLSFSFIRRRQAQLKFRSFIGWSSFYVIGCTIALISVIFSDKQAVVGHLILKGHDQSTWMTWKNPSQPEPASAWISSYEVEIQDAKGKKLYEGYIFGDYVGLRAQIITIHWPYKLLGFSHLYRLEMVHNGYSTAHRHQFFPHMAYAFPFPARFFEYVWEQLFTGAWKIPGIKSSTLESSYFPLREPHLKPSSRTYELIIGSSGLSSKESSCAEQTVSKS
jgi:hypothetical protein